MTILSSIYSTKQTLSLYILLLLVGGYSLFIVDYTLFSLIMGVIVISLILAKFDTDSCNKIFNDPLIRQVRDVLLKAGKGELSHRVIHIEDMHVMQGVAWGINDLLDQTEQFMRDIESSIDSSNRGYNNRIIFEQGYKGNFRNGLPE